MRLRGLALDVVIGDWCVLRALDDASTVGAGRCVCYILHECLALGMAGSLGYAVRDHAKEVKSPKVHSSLLVHQEEAQQRNRKGL